MKRITNSGLAFKRLVSIGVLSASARIAISFVSKAAIVRFSLSEHASDMYFLALSISSSVFSVCNSLMQPAIISAMTLRDDKSSQRLKDIVSELITLQLFCIIPVLLINIAIIIVYAQASSFVDAFGLCYMVILSSILSVITGIIGTNSGYMRIKNRNTSADQLLLAYHVLTCFVPLFFLPSRGITCYLLTSTLLSIFFLVILAYKSGQKPIYPSESLLIDIATTSRNMLKVALLSKLIPIVESTSISTFAPPGALSTYSLTRGTYGALLSFIDMSTIQNIIAECQKRCISENQKIRHSLNRLVSKVLFASVVMVALFISSYLVLFLLYGSGIYLHSTSLPFQYGLLAFALFPFAASSVVSLFTSPLLYILNDVRYAANLGSAASLPVFAILPLSVKYGGAIGASCVIGVYTSFIAIMHYVRLRRLTSRLA